MIHKISMTEEKNNVYYYIYGRIAFERFNNNLIAALDGHWGSGSSLE